MPLSRRKRVAQTVDLHAHLGRASIIEAGGSPMAFDARPRFLREVGELALLGHFSAAFPPLGFLPLVKRLAPEPVLAANRVNERGPDRADRLIHQSVSSSTLRPSAISVARGSGCEAIFNNAS